MVSKGLGGGGEWGVITSEYGVSFWGDENVLELDSGDGCSTLNSLKTNELYPVKRVNFIGGKLHLNKEGDTEGERDDISSPGCEK